jgi:type IV secretory pathway component VirB8
MSKPLETQTTVTVSSSREAEGTYVILKGKKITISFSYVRRNDKNPFN